MFLRVSCSEFWRISLIIFIKVSAVAANYVWVSFSYCWYGVFRRPSCSQYTPTCWYPGTPSSSTWTLRTSRVWTGPGVPAGCWPLLTAPACSLTGEWGTSPASATLRTPLGASSVSTPQTGGAASSLWLQELPSLWMLTPSSTKLLKSNQKRTR